MNKIKNINKRLIATLAGIMTLVTLPSCGSKKDNEPIKNETAIVTEISDMPQEETTEIETTTEEKNEYISLADLDNLIERTFFNEQSKKINIKTGYDENGNVKQETLYAVKLPNNKYACFKDSQCEDLLLIMDDLDVNSSLSSTDIPNSIDKIKIITEWSENNKKYNDTYENLIKANHNTNIEVADENKNTKNIDLKKYWQDKTNSIRNDQITIDIDITKHTQENIEIKTSNPKLDTIVEELLKKYPIFENDAYQYISMRKQEKSNYLMVMIYANESRELSFSSNISDFIKELNCKINELYDIQKLKRSYFINGFTIPEDLDIVPSARDHYSLFLSNCKGVIRYSSVQNHSLNIDYSEIVLDSYDSISPIITNLDLNTTDFTIKNEENIQEIISFLDNLDNRDIKITLSENDSCDIDLANIKNNISISLPDYDDFSLNIKNIKGNLDLHDINNIGLIDDKKILKEIENEIKDNKDNTINLSITREDRNVIYKVDVIEKENETGKILTK